MILRYTDRARNDIELAFMWYEKQRKGLGSEFLDCVENALKNIIESPEIYQVRYSCFRGCVITPYLSGRPNPFHLYPYEQGSSFHKFILPQSKSSLFPHMHPLPKQHKRPERCQVPLKTHLTLQPPERHPLFLAVRIS